MNVMLLMGSVDILVRWVLTVNTLDDHSHRMRPSLLRQVQSERTRMALSFITRGHLAVSSSNAPRSQEVDLRKSIAAHLSSFFIISCVLILGPVSSLAMLSSSYLNH